MADISVTAANVLKSSTAQWTTATAGEAMTAGQVVYLNADGKVYKADANDTSKDEFYGIALCTGVALQPVAILQSGDITIGGTMTAGVFYYVSGTAGGIAPVGDLTTGYKVIKIGYASTTAILKVNAENTEVILA